MTQIQGKTDFWMAVIADREGYTYTDEEVRAWCADPKKAEFYREGAPDTLYVLTGEALPDDGSLYGAPKIPNPLLLDDVMLQEDLYGDPPDRVLRHWERAVAVAEAMNVAGVQ